MGVAVDAIRRHSLTAKFVSFGSYRFLPPSPAMVPKPKG